MIEFRRKQIKKLQADDGGKRLWIGGNKSSVSAPCAEHDAGIATRLPKNRVNGATDSEIGCGVSPGFRALRHGLQRRSTCLRLFASFLQSFFFQIKKKVESYGAERMVPHPSCLTAIHLPHTRMIYKFCQKDGGEGLAARGLVEFVKVERMTEERSSSSIMPQAAKWHLPRSLWIYKFFIKAQGKA